MIHWEYLTLMVYRDDKYGRKENSEDDLDMVVPGFFGIDVAGTHVPVREALDDVGAVGWELCSAVLVGSAHVDDSQKYLTVRVPHFLYFKRPKS